MHLRSARGITLIEITVVLTVVAILTAAAAPVASRTIERARLSRAVTDGQAIRTALDSFLTDLPGYQGPKVDGTSTLSTAIEMLVSDGDTPRDLGPLADPRWDDPVGNGGGTIICDFLENHIVMNQPFADLFVAYPTSGVNNWRGAYISAPVDADPWGNRYAVNVKWLQGTTAERKNDVVVLSAGPDEQLDSSFETDGIAPGDDDVMVVVRRDAGLTVP